MKFSIESLSDGHVINAYDRQTLTISGESFHQSLLLLPEAIITDWNYSGFSDLTREAFDTIASYSPDIVILGTGSKQYFPRPELFRKLIESGIGMEVMATDAACRTYNILMSENRRVAAALILD